MKAILRPVIRVWSTAALALVVAGCQALPALPGASLDGTGWRAVEVLGQPPVAGREPTVYFETDRIGGSTGCNGFGGDITIDGTSVKLGEIASTLIGCEGAIGEVEGRFIQGLGAVDRLSVRADGMLVLSGAAGDLVFRPDASVVP